MRKFVVGPWIVFKANSLSQPLLEQAGRWMIHKQETSETDSEPNSFFLFPFFFVFKK